MKFKIIGVPLNLEFAANCCSITCLMFRLIKKGSSQENDPPPPNIHVHSPSLVRDLRNITPMHLCALRLQLVSLTGVVCELWLLTFPPPQPSLPPFSLLLFFASLPLYVTLYGKTSCLSQSITFQRNLTI